MKMKCWGWIVPSVFSVSLVCAQEQQWEASKDSLWKGQMGTLYKLGADCQLQSSADGLLWSPCAEKMWQDNNGNWFRLEDRNVTWSPDRNSWNAAEKWVDTEGSWFKVDNSTCMLLTIRKSESEVKESPFLKEKRDYKLKMSKAVRQLEREIATYRNNGRIKRKHRPVVEQLEAKKADMRARMREIYKKPDAEWPDYKKSLDEVMASRPVSAGSKPMGLK
jgi:hypothetical protein